MNYYLKHNDHIKFLSNQNFKKADIDNSFIKKTITNEIGKEAAGYIAEHFDLEKRDNILLSTEHESFFKNLDNINAIINLKKINHIYHLNTYFRSINSLLPDAGILIGCAETNWGRKIRIYQKYKIKIIAFVVWLIDFIFKRILPRLAVLRHMFGYFNRHRHNALSTAEILGRIVYNGFEIVEYNQLSDKLLIFVAIKTGLPSIDQKPTYGPFIKLNRVGKNGQIFKVFKLRTMHPYSEYLQDFVLKLHGYNHKGKPENDFRLANWGKFFRKFYLDEFPQIINLIKGDMNIVGVRPLSKTRFNQFPEDIKKLRIKYKPGFVPPYVALNMMDSIGNIEAERIYINEKEKKPFITDIKYFFKAVYNVLSGKTISE